MLTKARRLASVKLSSTKAITQKARQLKQAGKDIITLSQGEPDFETPEHILQAAKDAINDGFTRYTEVAGMLSLRQAIAEEIRLGDGVIVSPDNISVGCGAKQVVFNTLMAILSEGDEVIIPAPYWVSYPEMVRLCDGTPVIVECGENVGFKLTPALLEKAITPRTRCIMLNSPNNPSGAVYSESELAELVRVLSQHPDIVVISDEIYRDIHYKPATPNTFAKAPSMLAFADTLDDRLIVVNGVSKAYAMTGWRVGYGVGPADLIKAINMIQSQASSHTCSVAQKAAQAAYEGSKSAVQAFVHAFKHRRDLVVGKLSDVPGLTVTIPEGAFYVFVSCQELLGANGPDGIVLNTDVDVAEYLLDYAGVATVPGTAFGLPGYIRISYACSDDVLIQACQRIRSACVNIMLRNKVTA